jgi:hypothetical protein
MPGNEFSYRPTPMTPDGESPTLTVVRRYQANQTVKTFSIIQDKQDAPPSLLTEMIFGDLGSLELINISRHDLIRGVNISYTPFRQLSILNEKFNPLKILALADGSPNQFSAFGLNLNKYIPKTNPNNVSWDDNATKQNIVIQFVNIGPNEYVEVEIISQGVAYNDTI